MITWVHQHLRHGLDKFKIKSFQSADALRKLLSRLDFGLGNARWIEDHSDIFGTLYYRDIFKCIQFLLANLECQVDLDFEPVCLADLESREIYSEMNTGDWWWDTQDQLSAGATILPVICASYKTHLTNFWVTSMPGHCISWSVIFEMISTSHLKSECGFLLGWYPVPWNVPKRLTRHGISWFEQCCPHSGILTSLALAWNGIVLIDSRDNVICFWLAVLGIIQNKSWLLKSPMA